MRFLESASPHGFMAFAEKAQRNGLRAGMKRVSRLRTIALRRLTLRSIVLRSILPKEENFRDKKKSGFCVSAEVRQTSNELSQEL